MAASCASAPSDCASQSFAAVGDIDVKLVGAVAAVVVVAAAVCDETAFRAAEDVCSWP